MQTPDGRTAKVTKGAPQVILALAANAAQVKPQVDQAVNEFAGRGFRSRGVARTDEQGQWQFLGVLPLYDPPRDDSKATIETARQMGVVVKMVTGDQLAIAKEIARQLGLGATILDASLFGEASHHQAAGSTSNGRPAYSSGLPSSGPTAGWWTSCWTTGWSSTR